MKILLDSYFFFPFIRISIDDCSIDELKRFLKDKSHEIFRSELTLFEISAKGTKYVNNNILKMEDLINGLYAIKYIDSIQVIPFYYADVQILANELRKDHPDYIDCLILATAVNFCDILLTEDSTLIKNYKNKWYSIIQSRNLNFEVLDWEQVKKRGIFKELAY